MSIQGTRRRLAFAITTVLESAAVVVLSYAPFWAPDVDVLTLERRESMFTASFASVLRLRFAETIGDSAAQDQVRLAVAVVFGIIAVALIAFRGGGGRGLLSTAYGLLFAYVCIAAIWFQPWYIVWLVALAAIVPSSGIWLVTLVFTASVQWNYIIFDYLWIWWGSYPGDRYIQTLAAAVNFLPPVAVGAVWLAVKIYRRASKKHPWRPDEQDIRVDRSRDDQSTPGKSGDHRDRGH
ncbi:MAG TPA: hypothetical protein VMP10_05300 [Chloroflexota bacterium]|nr:hypothetical protein [Chloroflexota bacterium]